MSKLVFICFSIAFPFLLLGQECIQIDSPNITSQGSTYIINFTLGPIGSDGFQAGALDLEFQLYGVEDSDIISVEFNNEAFEVFAQDGTVPLALDIPNTSPNQSNLTGIIRINTSESQSECIALEWLSGLFSPVGTTQTCDVRFIDPFISSCAVLPPDDCGTLSFPSGWEVTNPGVTQISLEYEAGGEGTLPLEEVVIVLEVFSNTDPGFSVNTYNGFSANIEGNQITLTGVFDQLTNGPAIMEIFTGLTEETCIGVEIISATAFYPGGVSCDLSINTMLETTCPLIEGTIFNSNCSAQLPDNLSMRIIDSEGGIVTSNVEQDIYSAVIINDDIYEISVTPQIYFETPDLDLVTTADLIAMSRDILALAPLTQNLKYIAADVNVDQRLNILDIIQTRRIILGLDLTFPEGNSFFPSNGTLASAVFSTSSINYENSFNINVPIPTDLNSDFTMVITGDLTGTDVSCAEDAESSHPITLNLTNHPLKKGESYKIPISLQNFDRLSVLDFAFSYDNKAVKLNTISSGDLVMQDGVTHNINQEAGAVSGIWLPESMEVANARPTDPNQFYVEFTALQDVARLAQVFELQEGATNNRIYPLALPTPAERKTEGMKSADAPSQINWIEASNSTVTTVGAETSLHLLSPNPFTHQLDFSITSPVAQTGSLQLYSFTGQRVAAQPVRLVTGSNRVSLRKLEALPPGAYAYRLVTEQGTTLAGVVIK